MSKDSLVEIQIYIYIYIYIYQPGPLRLLKYLEQDNLQTSADNIAFFSDTM